VNVVQEHRSSLAISTFGRPTVANYAKGIVLTCSHEHCNCRVLIQEECHCEGVTDESIYRCVCGAELVPVKD
jgi:hypothetical protein